MGPKATEVYISAMSAISSGEWPAGQKIPSERELCEVWSVGRTMLRQVLARLLAEGVLDVKDRRGYYVIDKRQEQEDERAAYVNILRDWDQMGFIDSGWRVWWDENAGCHMVELSLAGYTQKFSVSEVDCFILGATQMAKFLRG